MRFTLPPSVRIIRRQRVFSACVVASLAVGISVSAGIFAVVESTQRSRLPFAHVDRLEHLYVVGSACNGPCWSVPATVARALGENTDVVEAVGMYAFGGMRIRDHDHLLEVGGLDVNVAFPSTLGARMAMGRAFDLSDASSPPLVMLSHALWIREFGGRQSVVGSVIEINGVPHTITGVLAESLVMPGGGDLWTSDLTHVPAVAAANRDVRAVVLLRSSADRARSRAALSAIGTSVARNARSVPARDVVTSMTFRDYLMYRLRSTLMILTIFAVAIGLLCAVNFAGLLLARGIRRRGEMGVRAALGASVPRLARQVIAESLVLCAIGGLLGALMSPAVIGALRAGFADFLPPWVEVTLGPGTLAAGMALAVLVGVVFALGPAIDLARPALLTFLRSASTTSSGRLASTRASLVAVQIGLATAVLVSLGALVGRWIVIAMPVIGFPYEPILIGYVSPDSAARQAGVFSARALLDVVQQSPGVGAAAAVMTQSQGPQSLTASTPTGAALADYPTAAGPLSWMLVTDAFFEVARPRLLRGRLPTAQEARSGAPVGVISRIVADRVFGGAALGARLAVGHYEVTIIGVIDDIRLRAQHERPTPLMITPVRSDALPGRGAEFWVRAGNTSASAIHALTATVNAAHLSTSMLNLEPLRDRYEAEAGELRSVARLAIGIFAIALALAGLGLYGLVAYTTEVRARELAIREAIGASRIRVAGTVLWGATVQALIGLAGGGLLGWIGASLMGRGMGMELAPALGATAAATVLMGLTVLVSSIGPLRGIWRRDLSAVLRG